jgi:hypothetical protein
MKRFLLIFCLTFTVLKGSTQDGGRLDALKIAYITKNLDLSPEEAQKFWPVYNQYSAELKQATKTSMRNNQTEIELDENILNIRKKYNNQFLQVLPPYKVDLLFKSEKKFADFVQKEIIRRRMKNQNKLPENP